MDDTSAILLVALVGGMAAAAVRLPPLLGFLASGFVLFAMGVEEVPALDTIADLGVTVLLFGVGLKLDVRSLLRREVWLTASVHMAFTTVVGGLLVGLIGLLGFAVLDDAGLRTWLLVGFALSFSSTVFVVKYLEERSASRSLGGRTAIGILVFQDLAAVIFLAVVEGHPPSPWAVLLVLLLPGAWLARRALGALGHDELLPLFGVVLALVPGYALFEAVGLKGDLGALVVGTLVAGGPRAGELAKSLFTLKDLLLVGFFISIGLGGLPTPGELVLALLLLLLLPLKTLGFAALLWACGLRRRTSGMTGIALTNYSEFGLIVAVAAAHLLADGWVTVLGTAVATSFVLASLPGRHPEYLVRALRRLLPIRKPEQLHPEDRPVDVQHAQAVVLGMGRVGSAAYERLRDEYGLSVIGIETSRDRADRLNAQGFEVLEGDATDPDLWERVSTGSDVRIVLLAMPFHGNNLDALGRLKAEGYDGTVAVVTQYDEDLAQATRAGADTGFQLYDGAGTELADRAAESAQLPPTSV
ncbi:MAG: potassium transporter Kef [Nocardioides sp.]|nr:potassium transporter Kef [Nocardioides sp.]